MEACNKTQNQYKAENHKSNNRKKKAHKQQTLNMIGETTKANQWENLAMQDAY